MGKKKTVRMFDIRTGTYIRFDPTKPRKRAKLYAPNLRLGPYKSTVEMSKRRNK